MARPLGPRLFTRVMWRVFAEPIICTPILAEAQTMLNKTLAATPERGNKP